MENLKNKIYEEIKKKGYTPINYGFQEFIEDEIKYTVITVEVKEKITGYKGYEKLLKQEKEIRRKLNLYEQNIILEII